MKILGWMHETLRLREGPEVHEIWDIEHDPATAPPQLYTIASDDGSSGLMWGSLEEYWVDVAIGPLRLDPRKLLAALIRTGPLTGNTTRRLPTVNERTPDGT